MKKILEVCLTPALIPLYNVQDYIVVIVDIFRATTSICYGIENGASAIIPVSEISECISYREKEPHYLIAAERDGQVVDGFNFGNSPFSYTREIICDKTVVLTTTNGTKAIQLSIGAKQLIAGSFINLTAICNWLKSQDENVLIVCAGWKNNFNLEDTLFAGAVTEQLKNDYIVDDSAIAANDLYNLSKNNLLTYLKKSSHYKRLINLGIQKDIEFCLSIDITTAIPTLHGNKLIKLKFRID